MTEEADLYYMSVTHPASGQQLIMVTGTRETVLDMALRVMLDSAPRWSEGRYARHRPTFAVDTWKVPRA